MGRFIECFHELKRCDKRNDGKQTPISRTGLIVTFSRHKSRLLDDAQPTRFRRFLMTRHCLCQCHSEERMAAADWHATKSKTYVKHPSQKPIAPGIGIPNLNPKLLHTLGSTEAGRNQWLRSRKRPANRAIARIIRLLLSASGGWISWPLTEKLALRLLTGLRQVALRPLLYS